LGRLLPPEEAGVLAAEADDAGLEPHLAIDLHDHVLALEPSAVVAGPGDADAVSIVEILPKNFEACASIGVGEAVLVVDLHRPESSSTSSKRCKRPDVRSCRSRDHPAGRNGGARRYFGWMPRAADCSSSA